MTSRPHHLLFILAPHLPSPPSPYSVCGSTPSCQIQFHISDWLYFGRTATMVKDSNQQILDHSRGLTPLTNPALATSLLSGSRTQGGSGNLTNYRYADVHNDDDDGPSGIYVKHYLHPLLLNILIRSIR